MRSEHGRRDVWLVSICYRRGVASTVTNLGMAVRASPHARHVEKSNLEKVAKKKQSAAIVVGSISLPQKIAFKLESFYSTNY